MSNKMFSSLKKRVTLQKSLKKRGYITEKQLKYFSYEYRKATNIHKGLHNVPGQPVISNCGTPTEKCS